MGENRKGEYNLGSIVRDPLREESGHSELVWKTPH